MFYRYNTELHIYKYSWPLHLHCLSLVVEGCNTFQILSKGFTLHATPQHSRLLLQQLVQA